MLFSMIRSVVKSFKVHVVEAAELTNRSHRIRHRSSGVKSVRCTLQAKKCITSCGEAPQSAQMSPGSMNTCACSPAVDGSVLIVVVRECIVVSGSVSAYRPQLGASGPSVLCCVCRF